MLADFDFGLLKKIESVTLPLVLAVLCIFANITHAEDKPKPSSITAEQVRLSEILINTPQPYDPAQVADARRRADEVHEALVRGNAFEDLARVKSQGPTAAQGGDIGYFPRGTLGQSIEDLVFGMKVGDTSDVVRTKQGFVILKVTDHLGPDDLPLEILNQPITPELRPYLQELMKKVRKRWYALIPYSARAPQMKTGDVTIQFVVQRDGAISDQRVAFGSGDATLDKAALAAVSEVNLSPPPSTASTNHLVLRVHFRYNPPQNHVTN